MFWTWISVMLCCAILASLTFVVRVRSSIQKYADDLRNVMRDMQLQTQQLTKVREAARETKKESLQRASELKELRSTIESLTKQLEQSTGEKQSLKDSLRAAQDVITDLRRKLARCEARCNKLEGEVTTASLTRWELLSKLHTDTTQRLAAIHQLRQPQHAPLLRDGSSPPSRQLSEQSISPMVIPKSPSESGLLRLRPDLTVSEDDEEASQFEDIAIGPSQFGRADKDTSGSGPSWWWTSDRRRQDVALSLLRTPWIDSMSGGTDGDAESNGSLANALQTTHDRACAGGLIARSDVSCAQNDDKDDDQSRRFDRIW